MRITAELHTTKSFSSGYVRVVIVTEVFGCTCAITYYLRYDFAPFAKYDFLDVL